MDNLKLYLGAHTARVWLFAYLAAVVAISFVHEPLILAALLLAALAAAGNGRWRGGDRRA